MTTSSTIPDRSRELAEVAQPSLAPRFESLGLFYVEEQVKVGTFSKKARPGVWAAYRGVGEDGEPTTLMALHVERAATYDGAGTLRAYVRAWTRPRWKLVDDIPLDDGTVAVRDGGADAGLTAAIGAAKDGEVVRGRAVRAVVGGTGVYPLRVLDEEGQLVGVRVDYGEDAQSSSPGGPPRAT